MKTKILITGGCGFVGSNLAILFKKYNPEGEIYCLDNLSRRGSELNLKRILSFGIFFIHGDVRNRSDFNKIPDVDYVIDAAAEPSVLAGSVSGELENVIDTNLIGTINTLYYARERRASIIFLSTSRVYPYDHLSRLTLSESNTKFIFSDTNSSIGVSKTGINERFPLEGLRSLYGATKLSSEFLINEFSNDFNIPCVINRCGVIAGPHQMGKVDQGVVVLWMARHYWKGTLNYIGYDGSGKQARDILHIQDLFELILKQISDFSSYNGKTFNIGGGLNNTVSLRDLTRMCSDITGNNIEIGEVLENRRGDIPVYITDNTKITALSGWYPKISIENLLLDIFDWIRKNESELETILK